LPGTGCPAHSRPLAQARRTSQAKGGGIRPHTFFRGFHHQSWARTPVTRVPFLHRDPQDEGPQLLEDLACGYWFSLVFFQAVEAGVFSLIESSGSTLDEIASALGFDSGGLERFLRGLCSMGLMIRDGDRYFNSRISSRYLVAGKEEYQGDSILWRRDLLDRWIGLKNCLRAGGRVLEGPIHETSVEQDTRIHKYLRAMDAVARTKAGEMAPFFEVMELDGEILDAGAGSGAVAAGFLDHFPSLRATFMDIPEVIGHTAAFVGRRGLAKRAAFCAANVLDPWPVEKRHFSLVILSNIIHAYSETELTHMLSEAAACLGESGVVIIHDFFFEHFPEKSALFDMNMFINTYNGRVFSWLRVREELEKMGLHATGLIPLETDTGLIVASKDEARLSRLRIGKVESLVSKIRDLGFKSVLPIPVEQVHVPDWTDLRCRFGCAHFGSPSCPPHAPTPEKTRSVFQDYTRALLLEGEPPTRDFQKRVLAAEREAFLAGFHKAFAYWAGPCSICPVCAEDGTCRNTKESRPSMEGAGIDVFETVKRAGLTIRTLNEGDAFVKYFALILLE